MFYNIPPRLIFWGNGTEVVRCVASNMITLAVLVLCSLKWNSPFLPFYLPIFPSSPPCPHPILSSSSSSSSSLPSTSLSSHPPLLLALTLFYHHHHCWYCYDEDNSIDYPANYEVKWNLNPPFSWVLFPKIHCSISMVREQILFRLWALHLSCSHICHSFLGPQTKVINPDLTIKTVKGN
jgi:hypothetical protein